MTARTSWAGALSTLLLAAALSAPMPVYAQRCDPTRQSCVPPGGGGGGGGTGGGTGGTCSAPPGGNPGSTPACGAGPATRSSSAPSTGGGNPINLVSGNKYQQEIDMAALPGVLGLELVRHYNSLDAHRGLTGANWRISYEAVLYDFGRSIQIVQADGRRLMFERPAAKSASAARELCTAADPADGQVRIEQDAQGRTSYHWRWSDGRTLVFAAGQNGGHPLQSITAASGEQLTLTYAPSGELVAVRDPQGRTLRFLYDAARQLSAIQTPVAEMRYRRDAQYRLIEVSTVAQDKTIATRRYHHEAERQSGHANALTGISLINPEQGKQLEQRLSTYAYDARGRAILSTKGLPKLSVRPEVSKDERDAQRGIEQIEVQYLEPPLPRQYKLSKDGEVMPAQFGITILTNSLGHKSQIKSAIVAGSYRLVEFTGAGCSTCPEPNKRYDYNAIGQVIAEHQLDASGKVRSSQRFEYDGYGRLTREGSERAFERYEYQDTHYPDGSMALGQQPVLIARPSMIPGKEHVARIDYNERGQPTSVTESGFSPISDKGELDATLIARTTSYRYSRINGRSVLTQIDGPLANGPKASPEDSDITQMQWDERGSVVTAIVQPGGFKSGVSYDDAARIQHVRNDEGATSRYHYTATGQLAKLERSINGGAVQTQIFEYDAQGRLIETGAGNGSAYKAQTRMAYDSADRLLWRAHALGWAEQWQRDSEGRVIEEGRFSSRIVQSSAYEWNEDGSLKAVSDNAGRRVVVPSSAPATSVRPEVSKGQRVPSTRYLIDDFGRVVLTRSADSGDTIRQFDAADRPIAMRDALNNEARYEYDAAGRIVKQSAQASNQAPIVTQWHYQGRQLVELTHPTQSERYTYDAQGQRTTRSVTVNGHTALTRHERDANGEITATTLPDGSRIAHDRNAQGQITALTRSHVHTEWLRGFEKAQVLAKDFERDLVGLSQYTAGNGIEARFIRSREGTLARVLYRQPLRKPMTARNGAPEFIGKNTQDTFERLLGIMPVHATPAPAPAPSVRTNTTPVRTEPVEVPAAKLPGALGQPPDPQALIDHRYLWDGRGNLLLDQKRAGRQLNDSGYAYDGQDRLIVASTQAAQSAALQPVSQKTEAAAQTSYYLHDAQGRRVLAQEAQQATRRIAYDGNTHRWSRDADVKAEYDASGQPTTIGARRFEWDAHGRLLQVRDNDKLLATYQYSHRNQRIEKKTEREHTLYLYDEQSQLVAELDAAGKITRQYVYAAKLPIAVIDDEAALHQDTAAWLQAFIDIGHILRSWSGAQENTAWLHTNHLGASEAATDAKGQLIWQASYTASGRAKTTPVRPELVEGLGTFALNLRLPGQYADAETGLHYNLHRYYDPERGQYISPDPLAQAPGYPDGPNPYSYVRYNPLRYVDPQGLVLFAFDGTGNDEESRTNVWQLARLYQDNDEFFGSTADGAYDWRRFYIQGVGTRGGLGDNAVTGGALALQMRSRIDDRLRTLDQYVIDRYNYYRDRNFRGAPIGRDNPLEFDLDITGFSRGAASARDFANQIISRQNAGHFRNLRGVDGGCVRLNIRFMGLFETVQSLTVGRFNQRVPEAVGYVAHAVARNEYRSQFPLESVEVGASDSGFGSNRIERAFVGAHSDVGGGYNGVGARAGDGGDLSDVALNWMLQQAQAQGLQFNELPDELRLVSNPIVHDETTAGVFYNPNPNRDRDVRYADGSRARGRQAPLEGMTHEQAVQLIQYAECPSCPVNQVGRVDMAAYLAWLREHAADYGNIDVRP
jgi:RHS repeat-associated protein